MINHVSLAGVVYVLVATSLAASDVWLPCLFLNHFLKPLSAGHNMTLP